MRGSVNGSFSTKLPGSEVLYPQSTPDLEDSSENDQFHLHFLDF